MACIETFGRTFHLSPPHARDGSGGLRPNPLFRNVLPTCRCGAVGPTAS